MVQLVAQVSTLSLNISRSCIMQNYALAKGTHVKRSFKKYLARFRNISSKYNRINDLSSSNLSLFYRYIIKIHLQSSIFLPRDFVILFILQDAGAPFVALYTFFTRQRWSSARPERSRAARSDDTRMRKV